MPKLEQGDGLKPQADVLTMQDAQPCPDTEADPPSPGEILRPEEHSLQSCPSSQTVLEIPVHLRFDGRTIRCKTLEIGPDNLSLIAKLPLAQGLPLSLKFRFGGICHLNLSGQITSCLTAKGATGDANSISIKFAAIRDWEQLILLSALKEIKEASTLRRSSLLTISVSKDRLALEAMAYVEAETKLDSANPLRALPSTLPEPFTPKVLGNAGEAVLPHVSWHENVTEDPSHPPQDIAVPTFLLLINGQELDTGRYQYFISAEKRLADPQNVMKVVRQLNRGHIPSNYKDYVFARYCVGQKETNLLAMQAAYEASKEFRFFPLWKRMRIMTDIYELLQIHKHQLIDLMVKEGHPHKLAEWEFYGMEQVYRKPSLEFYRLHLSQKIGTADEEVLYWKRRPDGVVCVTPPRNAPCSSASIAGFALLGGNTLIVKPPLRSPISTMYLWKNIVNEALKSNAAPPGTLNLVVGNSETILDEWITSPYVNDIFFIGDTRTGLPLGHRAFINGKKCILELSGNDMMFVWKDAALHEATQSLLDGFLGSTQICMVPKKAFIHEDLFEEFESAFLAEVSKLKVGLPSDRDASLSPVLKMAEFYKFLEDALDKGAKLLCGGTRVNHLAYPDAHGAFITPAVLRIDDINKAQEMRCVREENFFPLIPIIRVSADCNGNNQSLKDKAIFKKMITTANGNEYALRNSVWVRSPFYLRRFIEGIQNSGLLRINCRHVGFPSCMASHGGTGKSGGPYGELNYVWQKTTHLQGVSVRKL